MRKFPFGRIAVWASVSAIAISAPAFGQSAAAPVKAATDSGVAEIVITAQKRSEKLSDAPVAASVVTMAALSATDSSDISDLNKLVPSVQLNGSINGRVPMGVRGVSSVSNESTVGISSGVEVLVDGIPVPSDSMAGNALEDVARIEVLKGPQSTLGGRTASAGEINIVTYGPTANFTGGASATVTGDGEKHVLAHVSGPISDTVQFSLAAWDRHIDFPIYNLEQNDKTNQDLWGVRGKLLFKPTSNLDITLAAHYGEMKSHGSNFVYTYLTPGASLLCGLSCPPAGPGTAPGTYSPGNFTQAFLNPGVTVSPTNQAYDSPATGIGATTHDFDTALTIDYRLGSGITLSSQTSYQHESQTNVQDLFAVGSLFFQDLCACNVFLDSQTQTESIRQFTEELKLVSPADKPFSYILGAFFSDSKVHETYVRTLPPAAENLDTTPDTKTYDLYVRSTYKFDDANSVTAGVRFNHDKLNYFTYQTAFAQTFPVACQSCYSQDNASSDSIVGDISLEHKFDRNNMVYAKYARGYAPQAFNTSLALTAYTPPASGNVTGPGGATFTPADTIAPVAKESINNFELGFKGGTSDRVLTFDLTLFYTKYSNYQIQTFSEEPGVLNPTLLLVAAGAAQTKGIELGLAARPAKDTAIGLNAAYIDAKFTNYGNAPCWVGEATASCTASGTQDISGATMPNSPKFKFNINAAQTIKLNPVSLTLRADYTYRSSAEMLADQNPQAVQSAFGILNLSATLMTLDNRYSLAAFVNNVADKHYVVDMEDFWSGPWSSNAVIGQPGRDAHRFVGVRFDAKF